MEIGQLFKKNSEQSLDSNIFALKQNCQLLEVFPKLKTGAAHSSKLGRESSAAESTSEPTRVSLFSVSSLALFPYQIVN